MDDRGNAAPAVQEVGFRVIVRKSEIARQAGMDDRGNAAPAVQECDFRAIVRDNEIIIERGNAAPAVHIKNEGGITVFLSDNEAIIERDNAAPAVLQEDRIRLMVRGQAGGMDGGIKIHCTGKYGAITVLQMWACKSGRANACIREQRV